jgi:murein DD-endopeptidase MepM/ murein hydrolase activator NlpD
MRKVIGLFIALLSFSLAYLWADGDNLKELTEWLFKENSDRVKPTAFWKQEDAKIWGQILKNGIHTGIDFGGGIDGFPVYSATSGKAIKVKWGDDKGQLSSTSIVAIYNEDIDVTFLYLHMKDTGKGGTVSLKEGQEVEAGDLIGYVDSRGIVTGPHLHFEARKGKQKYAANDADKTLNPYEQARKAREAESKKESESKKEAESKKEKIQGRESSTAKLNTLSGFIRDQHGNPLPEASIWLEDIKGKKYDKAKSSKTGYFELSLLWKKEPLSPGDYKLRIEKTSRGHDVIDPYEQIISLGKENIAYGVFLENIIIHKRCEVIAKITKDEAKIKSITLIDEKLKEWGLKVKWEGAEKKEGRLETTRLLPDGKYTLTIVYTVGEGKEKEKEIKRIEVNISGSDVDLGEITLP